MPTGSLNSAAYDPQRHVTAGQLRELGFYLSEIIPDPAFVSRVAVGLDGREPAGDGSPTNRLIVLEPFVDPCSCRLAAVA